MLGRRAAASLEGVEAESISEYVKILDVATGVAHFHEQPLAKISAV